MDLTGVVLMAAILAVNVIGGGLLVRWLVRHITALQGTVTALESTVRAQGQTIAAIGHINKTVLDVFQAMSPERWSKEVDLLKKLADEKLEALLEKKGREMEQRTAEAQKQAIIHLQALIRVSLQFIPFIPKDRRAAEIAALAIPEDMKQVFQEFGAKVPDRSVGLDSLSGLGSLARALEAQPLKPPPERSAE